MKTSSLQSGLALRTIAVLLLSAITTQAQTYIFGTAAFPAGAGAVSIAMGDFNGDGIKDLAVVNEGDSTVSVLLGKPDGTFAPQVAYPTGLGPLAIVTGDFNGDDNLDLAVTNANCTVTIQGLKCYGRTVSILLGNGDGTFRPQFDYPTGTGPSSVATGDFNGDGNLDLAITNYGDNTVSVLLGNGGGTFQNQVVYSVASSPQSVVICDFNGDGKLDLAVGGSGVSVLLGNGNGTFQKGLDSPGGSPLAVADFNGDGKLDLFAGGTVLLGNGNGTFEVSATYPSGIAIAAADLNGDGKLDLVIAQDALNNDLSDYSVAVLLGNGDGTFQTPVQYGVSADPSYVVISDFNGDGRLDLAVAYTGNGYDVSTAGAVYILLGFGDGTFVAATDYASAGVSQLISADFNGDGKPDIGVTGAPGPAAVGVYLGNGDGTFQPEIPTSLTQSVGQIAAGDFNGDGKADLATVFSNCSNGNCLPGDVLVLIGNGDGTFQPPVDYTVGLQPEYLAVGDFNGDGKPDLAVTNFGSYTVSILINNGNGTFQSHVDYPAGNKPTFIATGDFGSNGNLDLAILNYDAGTISILMGNGNGTFTPGTPLTGSFSYGPIVVADFNGDGKLDLAVGSNSAVLIFLGNGDGTFQAASSYPDYQESGIANAAADFKGDGNLDLIASPNGIGFVASILLGNGDGSFSRPCLAICRSVPSWRILTRMAHPT